MDVRRRATSPWTSWAWTCLQLVCFQLAAVQSILIFGICPQFVKAVLPDYTPALNPVVPKGAEEVIELLEMYFDAGYTVPIIASFLFYRHGIRRSVRQLKRLLQKMGCKRRRPESSRQDIMQAIADELEGSGSCCGYRAMWQRLLRDHHLHVKRDTVRQLLITMDPDGVQARKQRRLRRRVYTNKGPHYLIHIDGYDKLKPYGFAIHGAIDGFSRKVLWLEVGPTNNDPTVVAKYFVDYIRQIKGVPHIVRTDRGTENTLIEDIQMSFRYHDDDERSGLRSFMYGKSTSNQRIERWWGSMRSGAVNYWLSFFKDMVDSGVYNNSCPVEKECMRFCFTQMLRIELHRVSRLWNEHTIRYQKNSNGPHGKPDAMFFLPELYGSHDYKHVVRMEDVDAVDEEFCSAVGEYGCSAEFQQIAQELMTDNGYTMPSTAEEGAMLFSRLKNDIVE